MSSHQGTNFNVLVSDLPRRAMSRVALNSIFVWVGVRARHQFASRYRTKASSLVQWCWADDSLINAEDVHVALGQFTTVSLDQANDADMPMHKNLFWWLWLAPFKRCRI